MYGFGYSAQQHVMVATVQGQQSDQDHEEFLRQLGRLDGDGAWRGRAVGLLLQVDPHAPPLSVYWRRRFAEHRSSWRSPKVWHASVFRSPIHRGMLTAMNWLKPPPEHVKSTQHATTIEAIAWLETHHGAPTGLLHELAERAQASTVRRSVG